MDKILRPKDVVQRLNVSRSTFSDWRAKGAFPPPIRLGAKAIGWQESAIQSWLDSRIDTSIDTDTRAQKSRA